MAKAEKYNIAMRLIHWLMAVIIIGLIAVGWYMEGLDDKAEIRPFLYSMHKSFGVTVILLFILRVVIRFISKIPPLPNSISKLEQVAAHGGHFALYALIIAVPVFGYVMSNAAGYPVYLFGIEMPTILEKNPDIGKIAHPWHGWLAYTLLAIIGLHVLGALKHLFVDKINIIKRMT